MFLLLLLACGSPEAPVVCDTLTCGAGEVCVTTLTPPTCQDLPGDGTCPDGTTETMCGGDGHACCCPPAPAPAFECVAGCGNTPSCDCVTCDDGLECMPQAAPDTFVCEPLPVP